MSKCGHSNNSYCSLKLIEVKNNNECWFESSYTYAIFYKTPKQILSNQFIIGHLRSDDSCRIGIICGEVYRASIKKKIPINATVCKSDNSRKKGYKLLSIYRNKAIEYEDLDKKVLIKNIIELVQEVKLIRNFLSEDAFYIGFLAGLELCVLKNSNQSIRNKLNVIYSKSRTGGNFYIR